MLLLQAQSYFHDQDALNAVLHDRWTLLHPKWNAQGYILSKAKKHPTIYGEKQEGFFRRRLKAIIMTFVLVLLFIFMLIVPVFGTKIIELFKFVDLNSNVTDNVSMIITFLQGPITWLIMYFFIKIL